jgi:PadR family transcriptional regulator, regulatory protein PadR
MNHSKGQRHRHLPAFILLRLAQGKAHGGAIYHDLMYNIPDFQCDTAAIYRTLRQLEQEEAVTFIWDTMQPGPARKIYAITQTGRQQLAGWKEDMEGRIKKLNCFLQMYHDLQI